jgi:hypothetical protein
VLEARQAFTFHDEEAFGSGELRLPTDVLDEVAHDLMGERDDVARELVDTTKRDDELALRRLGALDGVEQGADPVLGEAPPTAGADAGPDEQQLAEEEPLLAAATGSFDRCDGQRAPRAVETSESDHAPRPEPSVNRSGDRRHVVSTNRRGERLPASVPAHGTGPAIDVVVVAIGTTLAIGRARAVVRARRVRGRPPVGCRQPERGYTRPSACIASATRRNPAAFAPIT